MDAPKGSGPSKGQARGDSDVRRSPPVQASSQAITERKKATSVPSAGILAGLREYISPSRTSKGTDNDDASRYIHQLQDDLRKATAYRQKLDARHEEVKVAYGNATTKERQACAQAQTLSQEKQGLVDYVEGMQGQLDELAKRCHESERLKQAEEAETHKLRQQLITFKRSTMVSSKLSGQVTDEDVRSKMDMVFYATQDFAVGSLRGSQLDLDRLSQEAYAWLDVHLLNANGPPQSCTTQILICLVSRVLVESSAMKYYFGVSSSFPVDAGIALASAVPDDAIADGKAWLEPTRKLIAQINKDALRKSDQALLDRGIQRLHSMLVDALPMDWTAAEGGLRKIFAAAFELFRTLHSSKAWFVVEMLPAALPHELAAFDPNTMIAINNSTEDEVALAGRPIEVSVFPVVYKFGNEMGENRDEMTIVCKAKVVVQKRPRPLNNNRK